MADNTAPRDPAGTAAQRIADFLDADLAPWQREVVDQMFDPANKDKHLEICHLGRNRGYGWVWVPNV